MMLQINKILSISASVLILIGNQVLAAEVSPKQAKVSATAGTLQKANIVQKADKIEDVTEKEVVRKDSSNFVGSVLTYAPAATTDQKSPFSGSEEAMEELDKLEPIEEDLKTAVDVHNLIYRLRSYKNIQKQYNNTKRLYDKSLKLLKDSEQCTIDYLGRYFNNPIKVWSGIDMRENPQNHDMRQGLSAWAIAMFETAKAAEVSPMDIGDVVSVETQEKEVVNEYGDIIEYDTTINSSTSTVGVNVNTNSSEGGEVTDISSLNASSEQQAKALQEQTQGNYFKEPGRQEELEASARKSQLLNLDIGAEVAEWVAEYLANGENMSVEGTNPAWNYSNLGGVKKRFPVWNDQKSFYSQYLKRKYDNIKNYIKNYKIEGDIRDNISNVILERQKQYMNIAEAQITQAAVNAKNTARKLYDDKVEAAQKGYEQNYAQISRSHTGVLNALYTQKNNQINKLNQELEAINQNRNAYMTHISDINAENNRLQNNLQNLEQEVVGYDNMLSGLNQTSEQIANYRNVKKELEDKINELKKQIQESKKERDDLQKQYDEETEKWSEIKQKIKDVETQTQIKIAQEIDAFQTKVNKLKEDLEEKLEQYKEELETKNKNIDKAELAAKAAIQSKSTITAQKIISETDLSIEDAKETAYENIDKVYNAIMALGDDLYRGKMQETVAGYHQALIDSLKGNASQINGVDLKSITIKVHDISNFNIDIVVSSLMDEQMREMYLEDYRKQVSNTNVLLSVTVFDKMLSGIDTSTDTQYFVGSLPKEEDFRGPKTLPDYNLPPLREYMRLDNVDLQNLGKDDVQIIVPDMENFDQWNPKFFAVTAIDKEKFLNYGGKIPEIWKLMLTDKVFVDSDFEFNFNGANILSLGNEMSPLYRDGIYPCKLKGIKNNFGQNCESTGNIQAGEGVVDVFVVDKDKTNKGEYKLTLSFLSGDARNAALNQDLPTCQNITATCTGTKAQLRFLNGESLKNEIGERLGSGQYSELGSILNIYTGTLSTKGSVRDMLGYSVPLQSVVTYSKRMEARANQEDADDLSASEQINDDIYVGAQYNNNQVGDFLEHVEMEQTYKEALDDLENQVQEMKNELIENLRKYGFEPSSDFDISKTQDYELAVNKLKAVKNQYMTQAKGLIDDINPGEYDVLKDSKNSYDRVYQGLYLDTEAVMNMTMDIDDLSEWAENLKTATVNANVDETYEKEGDEDFENTLKSMKPAYCAGY